MMLEQRMVLTTKRNRTTMFLYSAFSFSTTAGDA